MRQQPTRWLIIAAFSAALGHLAWHSIFGPPGSMEHFVGGQVTAFSSRSPDDRQLYVRRKIFLNNRPPHAWIQVLSQDKATLYVNGLLVAESIQEGFPIAIVADLTPFLRQGMNVVAIAATQATIGKPPVISVNGSYWQDDGEHTLTTDSQWRCHSVFQRRSAWWFEERFDDVDWPTPHFTRCDLQAKVSRPSTSITEPGIGRWITPADLSAGQSALRREFDIEGKPSYGWLRLTSTSPYRLAVNGVLLDQYERVSGTANSLSPTQRTYEISPLLRQGKNVLALIATRIGEPPHLLADIGGEDHNGTRFLFGSDHLWNSHSGPPADWFQFSFDSADGWQPCSVESGHLDVLPWHVRNDPVQVFLPYEVGWQHLLGQWGVILAVGVLTFLACRIVAPGIGPAAYLALIAPTVAMTGAILAVYDPRVHAQDVYRDEWVYLAVAALLLQWGIAAFVRIVMPTALRGNGKPNVNADRAYAKLWTWQRTIPWIALALLTGTGFGLRMRDIDTEPLQWDEVENVQATAGFFERGFPSRQPQKDMPIAWTHTSEFFFVPLALSSLIFDDERYLVRFPSVVWSTLTIVLLYIMGRQMFGVYAGLLAAALAAFSPVCIGMSDFGRYFSQFQFFTLLTSFCMWRTVRGTGRISSGWLYATTGCFMLAYLTWEGGALLAVGLALAALLARRGRLMTILGRPAVWFSLLAVALLILAQFQYVQLQHTQFLWYGTSHSDVTLKPMWRFPYFEPWYYIWESSWNRDALVPMLCLLGAGLLAVRHPLRAPIRFVLTIYLTTCLLMSILLTANAWRYIHHMIPLMILLASAFFAALARGLLKFARSNPPAQPMATLPCFAHAVTILIAVGLVVVGGGIPLELVEMPRFRVEGYGITTFKFPQMEGPARYVAHHLQEGDIIMATDPFQVNHFLHRADKQDWSVHYWPQSKLRHPATLDDKQSIPLDRRDGTPVVADLANLKDIFYRHPRIWYVGQPVRHWDQNTTEMTAFMRENMDIVYQDADALVMLRDAGAGARPAFLRYQNERNLQRAKANPLP